MSIDANSIFFNYAQIDSTNGRLENVCQLLLRNGDEMHARIVALQEDEGSVKEAIQVRWGTYKTAYDDFREKMVTLIGQVQNSAELMKLADKNASTKFV